MANKEKESFVIHGTVVYSGNKDKLQTFDNAYIVCIKGRSGGVYEVLPDEYKDLPLLETGGKLIIPGFIDLHIHAPQYQFRGNGMDMELLPWLETYTFPEESKYGDISYAEKAYGMFVDEMKKSATTRACIFATSHREASLRLMEMLDETGLVTCVGKVNMDRNVPDYYVESTGESLSETEEWIKESESRGFSNTRPIITPRFTVSCTRELMKGLADLAEKYDLPYQSHLSENLSEIELVKKLEPDTSCYADSYLKAGLLKKGRPGIMAHCVWSDDGELEILKEYGVFPVHCPESNTNLASGAAPVKKYMEMGLNVGLATDVAGGTTTSMLASIRLAIQVSKLRYRLYDKDTEALTFPEAFFLATKGGGAFFGNAGSFDKGCPFDALIVDDMAIPTMRKDLTPEERAERFIYLGDERYISGKYADGVRVI
ncbi:MAG: amidohydrolase family protein [Lachnospiraceae bacterium]|nr:amidohydrolase family protein [Lachnospiraceae bacterium]